MKINATSCLDAWKKTVKTILEKGYSFTDDEHRTCIELQNLIVTIDVPADFDAPIETLSRNSNWIYPNKEELNEALFWKERYLSYEYSYGNRIFNYKNVLNQLEEFIIPLLQKKPQSRRAIVVLYDPLADSKSSNKEIPSIISLYFRIIDNLLTLTVILRSSDFFIGWPANIYQSYKLLEFVSQKLNVPMGSIHTISHSAHVFEEYREDIEKVLQ